MKGLGMVLGILMAASAAHGGEGVTALEAIKLLPPGKAARIACIEGRDAAPEPARWYLIVQDEFEENGIKEYVVSGSAIIAARPVSQFVTSLMPGDIVGAGAIKIDSSRAARIAGEYAEANDVKFSKLNFELKRKEDAVPVWKVSCLDDSDKVVGEVTLTAGKGSVLSHDGFASAPSEKIAKAAPPKKKRKAAAPPAPIAAAPEPQQAAPAEPVSKPGFFQRLFPTTGR